MSNKILDILGFIIVSTLMYIFIYDYMPILKDMDNIEQVFMYGTIIFTYLYASYKTPNN